MHALRVAGQNEAVFVEQMQDMPQAILKMAKAGDVVITMGAGSVGGVAGQVLKLAQGRHEHGARSDGAGNAASSEAAHGKISLVSNEGAA